MIRVAVKNGGAEEVILFSGDVGRWNTPIIRDPTRFDKADYVVVESTYGNRTHETVDAITESLGTIVNETFKAGGKIMIPSFAIERTQELLYRLGGLLADKRIPRLKVFVDSPMAIRVTEVFVRHPELFDEETLALLREGRHPCDFPGLEMCRSVDESKAVNSSAKPAIVIAGSGMCTGGRIKHHLVKNIGRPESTLLFVGYQAVGTLGRTILEGADEVRIFGKQRAVEARVAKINGLSAHADRDELFQWLQALKSRPKRVFVTHGEESSANSFGDWLVEKTGWDVSVPAYLDEVTLG
jgi:metallo-beta-lactamase family protein